MSRVSQAAALLLAVAASQLAAAVEETDAPAAAIDKKNVVLILADDLGWSDTTLYGTTKLYRTPNIERLAARGMLFTNAYSVSPLCSPTRASVLTGLHPARLGLTAPQCHLPVVTLKATESPTGPPSVKATTPSSVTRLDTKYETIVKALKRQGYATAHFGKWHLGPEPYSPLEHGFDIDIPHWPGPGPAGSYVAPWKFVDFDPQTPQEHIEDRMADEAARFMTEHKDEPFFLNYWMFSVHAPFDAKAELIDKYRSVVDPNDPQRSPTYAAMIESMDDAVGVLLDTLDKLEIADNTIVVFASDNGGNMYNEVDGTTPTSNAPLRGGKATMFEGGVRGPAIVAVPGLVEAGTQSDAVIQSPDFYPTLLDLLEIEPQPDQSFDGVSIVPALKGSTLDRESIFTYFPHAPGVPDWLPNAVSVHHGDWKLIRLFHAGENGNHRYKLFNLATDLGEQDDLAATYPERVASLDAEIEAFLVETEAVRPLPNPRFDPSKYDPAIEGVSKMKRPPSTKSRPVQKPVAGWQASGTATLMLDGNRLVVTSDGGDPYLSRSFKRPGQRGTYTLQVRMASNSQGYGQVFWKQGSAKRPFTAANSVKLDMTHDGDSHEYAVEFKADEPLFAIRLDPSRGTGEITIESIRLVDHNERVVYRFGTRR